MEENKRNLNLNIITAVAFLIIGLAGLMLGFSVWSILILVSAIATAVLIFLKKDIKLIQICLTVFLGLNALWGIVSAFVAINSIEPGKLFKIDFGFILAHAFLFIASVFTMFYIWSYTKEKLKGFNKIPYIVISALFLITACLHLVTLGSGTGIVAKESKFIFFFLVYILYFCAFTVLFSVKKQKKQKQFKAKNEQYTKMANTSASSVFSYKEGYINMVTHILLLIFTFGIWGYIWIYKTTKTLNSLGCEYRNPTTKLLLCIFVPFYSIYWNYKTGTYVDKAAYSMGLTSEIAAPCLLCSFFLMNGVQLIVQLKINDICSQKVGNDDIIKFKQLFDSGVITQEEFDAKKKQILGL